MIHGVQKAGPYGSWGGGKHMYIYIRLDIDINNIRSRFAPPPQNGSPPPVMWCGGGSAWGGSTPPPVGSGFLAVVPPCILRSALGAWYTHPYGDNDDDGDDDHHHH